MGVSFNEAPRGTPTVSYRGTPPPPNPRPAAGATGVAGSGVAVAGATKQDLQILVKVRECFLK